MGLLDTVARLFILAGALLAAGSAVFLNILFCFDTCPSGGIELTWQRAATVLLVASSILAALVSLLAWRRWSLHALVVAGLATIPGMIVIAPAVSAVLYLIGGTGLAHLARQERVDGGGS